MTVTEFLEMVDDYRDHFDRVEIFVNGRPVGDISFGLVAGTKQMIVNLDSHDED